MIYSLNTCTVLLYDIELDQLVTVIFFSDEALAQIIGGKNQIASGTTQCPVQKNSRIRIDQACLSTETLPICILLPCPSSRTWKPAESKTDEYGN